MSSKPAHAANYLPQLDGMRFFAVLGVLVTHYVAPAYQGPVPWGVVGVQLFFVLSGFLISGILMECRENVARGRATIGFTLRQFYARRFLRIFPLYYAALAVAVLLPINQEVREYWHWHALYLSNVLFAWQGKWHGEISHFWTLAVEEQFYLLWPFLMLLLPARALRPVMVALVALAVAVRLGLVLGGASDIAVKVLMPGNLDALSLGALLALDRRRAAAEPGSRPALLAWLPWLALGGLLAAVALQAAHLLAGEAFLAKLLNGGFFNLALGLVATWVIHRGADGFAGGLGRLLEAGPIVYLGRISYGIYVFHNFVPWYVSRRLVAIKAEPWGLAEWQYQIVHFVVCSAITLVASAVSWHLFEAPINGLKRFFPYAVKKPEPLKETAWGAAAEEQPAPAPRETAGPPG